MQYRLDHGKFSIGQVENEQVAHLPDDAVEGKFVGQLEVKIPSNQLGVWNYTIIAAVE